MTLPTTYSKPDPEQDALAYHEIYRAGRQGWVWPVAGILTFVVLSLLVGPFLVLMGFLVYFLADGGDVQSRLTALSDIGDVTPSVLLFVNLVLIVAIPISWFCIRVFHGLRPRWLSSVGPRIRWRWLAASTGLAFLSLLVVVVVGSFLPGTSDAETLSTEVNDFTRLTRDFLIVIVLFTPLQAVAEEYAFRGYLTQAFGGVGGRVVAVLGPALLFALAHGLGQSLPIFFDRFAFGVVAGVLVILTGGLEAAIAMHVLNNLLAYGLALAYSDMTTALTPTGGGWGSIVLTLLRSLVFLGLTVWVARRMGVQIRTRPDVLEASGARV